MVAPISNNLPFTKAPNNTHNTNMVIGVKDLISSQGFGYGERERLERMDGCWLLIFARFLSTLKWELGLNFVGNDEYVGWVKG